MLKINHLTGFNAGIIREPTRTYLDRGEDETNLTTYTFSSFSLGGVAASRRIVVGIIGSNGGANNRTIDSVTVGGVSATVVVQANDSGRRAGLAIASVPTGLTGDIVVTFSGGEDRCVVWAWAAYNLDSATAVDTASSTADTNSLNLNTSEGGMAFACSFRDNNVNASWTGLTEDNDEVFSNQGFTAASLEDTSSATPLTVECDWEGSSLSDTVGVAASFL